MGISPRFSPATRSSSMSTKVTLCPVWAKHAPVTKPTYPAPTTPTSNLSDVPCMVFTLSSLRPGGAAPRFLVHAPSCLEPSTHVVVGPYKMNPCFAKKAPVSEPITAAEPVIGVTLTGDSQQGTPWELPGHQSSKSLSFRFCSRFWLTPSCSPKHIE